ncbi:hypothetical protein B0A62_13380 [Flavobacterium hydatis]|uniref:Uncharacterized protein n=1 Tax=Flavobacterium hydatis TaxID=991 RepID=A0ABX4CFT9_FLAHY|nr:hypothetical protein B0A62_13380 [Flavobacterium hydatis]
MNFNLNRIVSTRVNILIYNTLQSLLSENTLVILSCLLNKTSKKTKVNFNLIFNVLLTNINNYE